MSLITEALQLKKNNPRNVGGGGQSFPPMRRTPVSLVWILLAVLSCGGVIVAAWKGTWLLEKAEALAGFASPSGAAPAASPAPAPSPESVPVATPSPSQPMPVAAEAVAAGEKGSVPATEKAGEAKEAPAELQPLEVNLALALIEDEKARQQLDEENQKKIEGFLRRMDVQGVCHQGEDSTALVDTVLVRPGDPVGDFGLILKAIEDRRLVFADRNGREFSKSY